MDTLDTFYSSILEDVQSGQFQLPERYAEQYKELGKLKLASQKTFCRPNYEAMPG